MNFRFSLIILIFFTYAFSIETDYLEYDDLVSLTDYYISNPLNINNATVNDIYELPYLNEITAERIYERIDTKGKVQSLNALVEENILDREYAEYLKKCIVFDEDKNQAAGGEYSARFKRTLERSRAYNDSIYFGNPSLFTHKLNYSSEMMAINVLIDKEPGEANYTDNMKGNVILQKGAEYRLILGNYNIKSFTGMLQKEGFTMDRYSFSSSNNFHDYIRPTPSSSDYSGYNGFSGFYTYKNFRVTGFYGQKDIAATLSDAGEITSVNLYAYTRTLSEIERYHNSMHEVYGAGFEGKSSGIGYGTSVSNEKFNRNIEEGSNLFEGKIGELFVVKKLNSWSLRADAGTDFAEYNVKLNAVMRSKKIVTNFYYGYIQKDKFALSSSGMMFGNGEEEQVFGTKFKIKVSSALIFISENLIYSTEYSGTDYPGSQFSIQGDLKVGNITIIPLFRYKYKESADNNYISKEETEYLTKLKLNYEMKQFDIVLNMNYADNDTGYGYLLSSNIDWKYHGFKLRIGNNIYYSTNGTVLYSAVADIGKYPSLSSFSGLGRKSYIMFLYTTDNFEISSGISKHIHEDTDISGSGYDLINSNTVHNVEVNFKYSF